MNNICYIFIIPLLFTAFILASCDGGPTEGDTLDPTLEQMIDAVNDCVFETECTSMQHKCNVYYYNKNKDISDIEGYILNNPYDEESCPQLVGPSCPTRIACENSECASVMDPC